MIEGIL
jgi:hypothetical protein